MAGFTPINPSREGATQPQTTRRETKPDGEEKSASRSSKTVASQYLGRDENATAIPVKKTTAKGKKRRAAAGDSSTSKRRKSSNIDRDLQVQKQRPKDDLQVEKATSDNNSAERPKSKKTTTAKKQMPKNEHAVSSNDADDRVVSTKPVSIYAPPTSMDALDSTSQRTSFDSIKANLGQSFTLYQGQAADMSCQSNVTFSQPQLQSAQYDHTDVQKGRSASRNDENDKRDISRDSGLDTQPATNETLPLKRSARLAKKSREKPASVQGADSDDFRELYEPELTTEDIATPVEELESNHERQTATPPPRARKHNMREVDEHEDYGGLLLSEAEAQLLEKMNNASEGKIKPIVRKPCPPTVLDRSPIFGASRGNVLRTSFRIGEALTFGAQAVRCNTNATIELYARATMSTREGRKQHFVFKDLYHDKPPYLEGTFELWNQARLWDLDSAPFLNAKGPGILSRVIGRMRREGSKWRLEVLSVWEASWEDVNYVAGIYGGKMDEDNDDI